ncbi:MAG: nicotinate-nucleotide adenylyltransferase [Xanthomonadales bacterium]|nr:nicotinate-nucleotide adenylyltransferase [Xanthomonadales bacterium]
MSVPSIVILGGTFDPVHFGHLRAAEEIRETLDMDEFRFLPCGQPPHRDAPHASASQRLEMLRLALADWPDFTVDDREVLRQGPSYMVDTLSDFRTEYPDAALVLVIGQDAANSLDHWHRWRALPGLAHLVIMSRHGDTARYPKAVEDVLLAGKADRPRSLADSPAGRVLNVAIDSLPVSASAIRALISSGRSARFLVPDPVLRYIQQQGLYG